MYAQHSYDPAFPVSDSNDAANRDGISVRDYFAAAALQGICAGDGASAVLEGTGKTSRGLALAAYQIADKMLEVRGA